MLFAHHRTLSSNDVLSSSDVASAAQGFIFVVATFAFVYACIVHHGITERVVLTEVADDAAYLSTS